MVQTFEAVVNENSFITLYIQTLMHVNLFGLLVKLNGFWEIQRSYRFFSKTVLDIYPSFRAGWP